MNALVKWVFRGVCPHVWFAWAYARRLAPMYSLVALRDIVLMPPFSHSVQYLANGIAKILMCLLQECPLLWQTAPLGVSLDPPLRHERHYAILHTSSINCSEEVCAQKATTGV